MRRKMVRMPVAAIIVAAGSSSRLGQPKQLLMMDGEPMLQRVIRFALTAGVAPVLVVLGANQDAIRSSVDFGAAMVVDNADWKEGLASSIRAGLQALEKVASSDSGVLLMGCDQPRVTAPHLRQLIETFAAQASSTVIASAYAGVQGIPAVFPREAVPDLLALRGDRGARALLGQPPWPLVSLPLDGGEIDIDRPEDLANLG